MLLWLSPAAVDDLDAIWLRIARDDAARAESFVDRIVATTRLLADNPLSGRTRDELGAGLRSFPTLSWVVFYRVTARVEIVRVLHGRRDSAALL